MGPLGFYVRGQMDAHGHFTHPDQRGSSGEGVVASAIGVGMFAPRPRPAWERPDPNPMPRFRIWRWWP